MHFGHWMREQRVSRRKTQAECAVACGMKVQYWSRLEKHIERPELTTVLQVARALDVPEELAVSTAGYAPASIIEPDAEVSRLLRQLRPDQQAKVLKVFRTLVEVESATAA